MRYLIRFSYDGTNFCGYQKQPKLRSVEGCFEKALYEINNHQSTKIVASGRTDAGVHALGQTAHFDIDVDITLYKLKCALNSLLPEDIHVFSTSIVDKDFHARYMVKEKTYEYILNMGEYNPLKRKLVYQHNKKLNIDKMKKAIRDFKGKHNFEAFVSESEEKDDYMREIFKVNMKVENDLVSFTFTGNGFMKYQVRNMVGTLIKIGQGKLEPTIIDEIFKDINKRKYITTAKAEGLYLKEVRY